MDAHVHIHDCFDLSDFLDCAYENFRREMESCDAGDRFNAAILLTESCGTNWYDKLRNSANDEQQMWKNWSITRTDERE